MAELAGIVTAGLQKHNISATLVGGAVVSIYTQNEYQSHDLDFISPNDHQKIIEAMIDLGFSRAGRSFEHPSTHFTIEFPTGPLAIGDDVPVKPEGQIKTKYGKVTLLSPTQCVMDRLAWFYHNNDRQCLDQAVMVATDNNINLTKVKRWSEKEKSTEKFQIFLNRLKATKK
ncbi:nucleotidyltransferase family protein [Pseudobdellovibrio exovorus]|uniref:nucleotidyltransferase family protein n=1 Tax=Pseudobdellovibrio exovorus TaxID=453816 RepID=UPI0011D1C434|nr:nucleotidyltransferase family protein [Pseudobdellovibrio exovorus]